MFNHHAKSKRLRLAVIAALLVQALAPFLIGSAQAAPPFTYAMVRFDRMAASSGGNVFTSGTVCASQTTANVAGTETTVKVVFPAGYTVSATVTDWAVNSTSNASWPSGAVAWTGIAQPTAAPASNTVNFVSGDLASAGVYCFNWTNTTAALKTPAAAANNLQGSVTTRTGAYPGTADEASSNYATAVIGTSTSDQIAVTAVVPPTFVFTLTGLTQPFASNLDSASTVSTSSSSISVTTNANSGWVAYVKDLNSKTVTDAPNNHHGALQSTNASNYKISNNTTSSLGTAAHFGNATQGVEDYGMAVTTVTAGGGGQAGVPSANAAYDSTASATCTVSTNTCKMGTLDPDIFRSFASSTGTSNGDSVAFVQRANIAGITPAATDYSDTVTIVAAGKF